jgi:hypothetical protein
MSLTALYLIQHAYALTSQGLILIRTGLIKQQPIPPETIWNEGFHHYIKVNYTRMFPMEITVHKNGTGEVTLPLVNSSYVKLFLNDARTFQQIVYEGFRHNNSQ